MEPYDVRDSVDTVLRDDSDLFELTTGLVAEETLRVGTGHLIGIISYAFRL